MADLCGPIERDCQMERDYIPLPGGWEVQTKGKGSTFRICDPQGERLPIPDTPYLHETLERMARDVHAASTTPPPSAVPEGWVLVKRAEIESVVREMDTDEKGKPYVYTKPSMVIWTDKWRGWVGRLRAMLDAAPAPKEGGGVMVELHPIHHSVPLGGIVPRRMSKTRLTDEQAAFVEKFALSIFADCVNAGRTFQDAITACYLSGLQNGLALAAAPEPEKCSTPPNDKE